MRGINVIVVIALAFSLSFAQAKPSVAPTTHVDSMKMSAQSMAKDYKHMGMAENKFSDEGKWEESPMHNEKMERYMQCHMMGDMKSGQMRPWMMTHGGPARHMMMACMMLCMGFFTVIAVLNILFTILVSLDMARHNRFNGLWIPILLIAGVPGTAIYAIFRLGDAMNMPTTTAK